MLDACTGRLEELLQCVAGGFDTLFDLVHRKRQVNDYRVNDAANGADDILDGTGDVIPRVGDQAARSRNDRNAVKITMIALCIG